MTCSTCGVEHWSTAFCSAAWRRLRGRLDRHLTLPQMPCWMAMQLHQLHKACSLFLKAVEVPWPTVCESAYGGQYAVISMKQDSQ